MAAAALLSSPSNPPIHLRHHKPQFLLLKPTTKTTLRAPASASDNGGATGVLTTEKPNEASAKAAAVEAVAAAALVEEGVNGVKRFEDERWVNGTWDLKRFQKDGNTDWDSVIDAEARRRKWLENNPEASSNDNPVNFDTSIIPWWAWIKKFHLPEAELLNGRAAMIGFFMAYLVDSLTGVGLVDQTGNFICKTLLFVAVLGVLLIRKYEDMETLKKLLEESTFYDKQWQATWQDDPTSKSKTDD